MEKDSDSTAELTYLDPGTLRVMKVSNGIYSATLGEGASMSRVHFLRAFPETAPDEYIEVWNADDKAVGILRNLDGMESKSRALVREALARKYFRPTIRKILSLRVEFGFQVWQVQTDKGHIEFTVSQPQENIHRRGRGRLLITDVDENVYEITNWREMDPDSRRWLEART